MTVLRRIDLIVTGSGAVAGWPLGQVRHCAAAVSAGAIATLLDDVKRGPADGVLLWDPALGAPDPELANELLGRVADVHHGGLSLGQASRPAAIHFIEPVWMHNCDPPPDRASTSWRVSFRACLIRRSVLEQMDGPCAEFHDSEAAALELGFRWLRRGVFVRHEPRLAGAEVRPPRAPLDVHDELLFAQRGFGASWSMWAAARGSLTGTWSRAETARLATRRLAEAAPRQTFVRAPTPAQRRGDERVTVLVPTIERYPYLRVLLEQLRHQTVAPHEIIVIDQTPAADRDASFTRDYSDLPLRWITLDQAGQCSSRNAGLKASTGDHILFVDDDDEVKPTLIQLHLEALARYDSDASCGIAHEVGIPTMPENFTITRASDVFPTNNTMVRRSLLERTGLFDLAFDRQPRADGDLGMRAHLSGAFMVLNPEIDVLHHHAPRGGLRKHGARVITYASSRGSLWQRHLPAPSEIYLAARYFGDIAVREVLWQRSLGTLSSHGDRWRRLAKGTTGALMLPNTMERMRQIHASARQMIAREPQIPQLTP